MTRSATNRVTTKANRRDFLRQTAVVGGLLASGYFVQSVATADSRSPNEKLNIAFVGAGGQANFSLGQLAQHNVVALCDVDESRAGESFAKYPQAKRWADYRPMLDEMHSQIDAVVVATPDHSHAPAAARALRLGKHVYCEKPLTHTVFEARTLARLAAEHKLATQMGTQIHALDNYRRVVELVQRGAIGKQRTSVPSRSVRSRWG